MDRLEVKPLSISGVFEVKSHPLEDERGFFKRLFCEEELKSFIHRKSIVNVNFSMTKRKGTIRGIHFQHPPKAELKIIQCLQGNVWDVFVDVRQNSSTFLTWDAVELSSDKNNILILPEGVAHGFQTLEDDCKMLYMHTEHYDKTLEDGLRYSDPFLNISWPLAVTNCSERDENHKLINKYTFRGLNCEM
ncbi:MAG: dTDP-4-dehydrorhamnose 3,5-epimerase family protein [Pseudomonadota bacterium]